MKVTKIEVEPPVDPVVATLEVTQKELDLLTHWANFNSAEDIGMDMYRALEAAGGNHKTWNLNPTGHTSGYQIVSRPSYKGE